MQSPIRWLTAAALLGAAAAIVPFVANAPAAPTPDLVSVITTAAPGAGEATALAAPAPMLAATAPAEGPASSGPAGPAHPLAHWLDQATRHVVQPGETLSGSPTATASTSTI